MNLDKEDKGHRIAVERAIKAYNRARGGFIDWQTAIMYLLESLEIEWTRVAGDEVGKNVPTFDQMTRAASRMARETLANRKG